MSLRAAGLLCLSFFAAHAAFHLAHGRPEELLWTCTAGSLLCAVGLLLRRPAPVGVAVCWLLVGNFFWALYLLGGGDLYPTSLLTHGGGLVLGLLGVRRLGWPRWTWLRASAALLLLQILSRAVTPPAANVNLAFSVHHGWETIFPNHTIYEATLLLGCGAAFALFERVARWRLPAPRRSAAAIE